MWYFDSKERERLLRDSELVNVTWWSKAANIVREFEVFDLIVTKDNTVNKTYKENATTIVEQLTENRLVQCIGKKMYKI